MEECSGKSGYCHPGRKGRNWAGGRVTWDGTPWRAMGTLSSKQKSWACRQTYCLLRGYKDWPGWKKAMANISQISCYMSLGICSHLVIYLLLIRIFSCQSKTYGEIFLSSAGFAKLPQGELAWEQSQSRGKLTWETDSNLHNIICQWCLNKTGK